MTKKIFRASALERLQSPDQLNTLMRVVQPTSWLALLMVALIIASGVVWGFLGSIPHQVPARGILIHREGVHDIVSVGAGQVSDVFVEVGDRVRRGQIVARIEQPVLTYSLRDARADLKEARNHHAFLLKFHKKHLEGSLDNLTTQKRNLKTSRRSFGDRSDFLESQIRKELQLKDKGILPLKDLEATREKYDFTKNELNRIDMEIENTVVKNQELRAQAERELTGSQVELNDLLRKVKSLEAQFNLESRIRSKFAGRVVELKITVGTTVAGGTPVITVEPLDRKLVALLYVSPAEGKKIRPGMEIDLSPSTVKRDEYGSILGLVTTVSEYPATRESMLQILGGNRTLVESFLGQEAPISLYANLLPDAGTTSGYRWSSSRGPDLSIQAGTLCTAIATVERKRPISFLMPIFKKLGGI